MILGFRTQYARIKKVSRYTGTEYVVAQFDLLPMRPVTTICIRIISLVYISDGDRMRKYVYHTVLYSGEFHPFS